MEPRFKKLTRDRQDSLVTFLLESDIDNLPPITERWEEVYVEAYRKSVASGNYERALIYISKGLNLPENEKQAAVKAKNIKDLKAKHLPKNPKAFFEQIVNLGYLQDEEIAKIAEGEVKDAAYTGSLPALEGLSFYYENVKDGPGLVSVGDRFKRQGAFGNATNCYLKARQFGAKVDNELRTLYIETTVDENSLKRWDALAARIARELRQVQIDNRLRLRLARAAFEVGDYVSAAYLFDLPPVEGGWKLSRMMRKSFEKAEEQNPIAMAQLYFEKKDFGRVVSIAKNSTPEVALKALEILGDMPTSRDAAEVALEKSKGAKDSKVMLQLLELVNKLCPGSTFDWQATEILALYHGDQFERKGDDESFKTAVEYAKASTEVVQGALAESAIKKGRQDLALSFLNRLPEQSLERLSLDEKHQEVAKAAKTLMKGFSDDDLRKNMLFHLKNGKIDLFKVYLQILDEKGKRDPLQYYFPSAEA